MVFADEICWGTPDFTNQQPRGLDLVPGETLDNAINDIENPIMRSDRMQSAPQQGYQRPGGDIPLTLQPNTVPILLRHALCRGLDVRSLGSGPYTHTFHGMPDLDDGFTLEKRFAFRDSDDIVLQYRGCRVNSFFWQAPLEGIVTARVSVMAKREVEVDPGNVTGSTDDDSLEDHRAAVYASPNEPFNSFHCSIEAAGEAVATINSADMNITNNFDPEGFALNGSAYRADLSEGDRAISGNLNPFFTRANYDRFYSAFKNNDTLALRFTFTCGHDSLGIYLPSCKIRGNVTPKISAKAGLSIPLTYKAFRDDSGSDIFVTVVSSDHKLNTSL